MDWRPVQNAPCPMLNLCDDHGFDGKGHQVTKDKKINKRKWIQRTQQTWCLQAVNKFYFEVSIFQAIMWCQMFLLCHYLTLNVMSFFSSHSFCSILLLFLYNGYGLRYSTHRCIFIPTAISTATGTVSILTIPFQDVSGISKNYWYLK